MQLFLPVLAHAQLFLCQWERPGQWW